MTTPTPPTPAAEATALGAPGAAALPPRPALSRARLLLAWLAASVLALLTLVAVVLPAEWHRDPTGFGQFSGLMALSAPRPVQVAISHDADQPWRSDEIEIALAPGGQPGGGDELEWKLRLRAGQTLVYSWQVQAPEGEFYADFHGQSDAKPTPQVISYRAGLMLAASGALVAPFDGIHGWYLQNQSDKAVRVKLRIAGFYALRPDPFAPE